MAAWRSELEIYMKDNFQFLPWELLQEYAECNDEKKQFKKPLAMDTYLMMLYVSLDQERAMKKLFSDNGWKYLKPDLLQFTDDLGGMIARSMSKDSTRGKNSGVTSPPGSNVTSIITIPSRPATRSQKSKTVNQSAVQKTRSKIDIDVSPKNITTNEQPAVSIIKGESGDQVDAEDLNDYFEYGDEDDDYIDDDKEVKKKVRKLARNSDGCDDTKDEIIAKLDGTEDTDPDNISMVCGDGEINTDDEGNESNTDDMANFDSQSMEDQETAVKIDDLDEIAEKKEKQFKNQGSLAPVQYQCGSCKIKFLNKKVLNKHLTDKVCREETDYVELKESDAVSETEQNFNDILLEETDKIGVLLEGKSSEDKSVGTDERGSKGELNEEDEGAGNRNKRNFYQCDQCELTYKTPYNLKTHQAMKHRMTFDESFECNVCYLSYGSEHILDLHKKDKHPPSGDPEDRVQCDDCGEWCEDFKSYTNHKKKQHNIIVCLEVNRSHVCSICGKGFTRSDSLKNHCDIIHLGTKKRKQKPKPTERKYVCDFCGKAFLRQNNLSEHISVKHENTAKKYKCKVCDETFLRPYSLEYHTNKKHLHTKPYKCDKCHKTYFSRINLRQHQDHCYKEEEEKEACPYCDKRFCHKRNLSMHIEAIHSQSPLTCECGFVIKWRSSLAKHRRRCSLYKDKEGNGQIGKILSREQIIKVKDEQNETLATTENIADVSALPESDPGVNVDAGFTTISTDAGMQVISNEIAQALRDQGLLVDGAVAGTLKMEDGRTVVEEDPSVQSVYYVIMKE